MYYILSAKNLKSNAKILANSLAMEIGEQIIVRTKPSALLKNICIIRYGNSMPSDLIKTEHNLPEVIKICGNKLVFSNYLREREIPHVELNKGIPASFPVVLRKKLNAGGGIGMVICKDIQEFQSNSGNLYWWSNWYKFKFELGVHVLGGEITRVFSKKRKEGLPPEEFPRRNTNNGYKFVLKEDWRELYGGIERLVRNFYNNIPISITRIDIGFSEVGGYRIIEANSAPDLSQNQNTLLTYTNYLHDKIKEM